MSVGSNLNEMENIEENVVTKGAKPAEPMQKLTTGGTSPAVEDLGGPTPENYKADDDSAKLKVPSGSLKQVKDVVNKGAKSADPAPAGMKEEEQKPEDEVVAEQETTTDEVVAEEPETTEDAVAEHHTKDEEGNVISIEEKPEKPKSNNAVVGAYMFDESVFEMISTLQPSKRGEYEITDLCNLYVNSKNCKNFFFN